MKVREMMLDLVLVGLNQFFIVFNVEGNWILFWCDLVSSLCGNLTI